MRLFLLVLVIPLMSACSLFRPGCFIQEKVEGVAVSAIVTQLQCSNEEAVHADIHDVLGKLGLCQSQTGLIADGVCPMVVGAVTDFVAKNAIPMKWGCSADNAKEKLSGILLDACKKIPVAAK